MKHEEFFNVIKPLIAKFGKTTFDDRKVEMIYETVKYSACDDFQNFVDHCIGEDVKPKLSDFKQFSYRTNNSDSEMCPKCEDSGWDLKYFAEHDVAKRCDCRGGPKRLYEIMQKDQYKYQPQVDRFGEYWGLKQSAEKKPTRVEGFVVETIKKL